MTANENYKLELTPGQLRVLHHALEKYIRNHDVVLRNNEFGISEMRLLFADLSRYCELCETLNKVLYNHDNQPYKEDK